MAVQVQSSPLGLGNTHWRASLDSSGLQSTGSTIDMHDLIGKPMLSMDFCRRCNV